MHFPLQPHVVGGCVADDCVIRGVVLPGANDGVWLSHSHWHYSDDSHSQCIARPSSHHKGSTPPSHLCRNTPHSAPTPLPPNIGSASIVTSRGRVTRSHGTYCWRVHGDIASCIGMPLIAQSERGFDGGTGVAGAGAGMEGRG